MDIIEATTEEWLIAARNVQRKLLPADHRRVWDRLAFRDYDSLWIANTSGAVVGYVWTYRYHDLLIVNQLAVARSYQKAGVGTSLLRHVADGADRDDEISDLWIKPIPSDDYQRLRAFYRRRGFRRSEEQGYLAGSPAEVCAAIDAIPT